MDPNDCWLTHMDDMGNSILKSKNENIGFLYKYVNRINLKCKNSTDFMEEIKHAKENYKSSARN